MFVRSKDDVANGPHHVDWGNGESWRLLTQGDGMGFTVCHTLVRAGTESLLEYRNHLEACYCIAGSGNVEDMDGRVWPIKPGDLYVLDKHDRHWLRADPGADMILVSVFNPALKGTEVHNLDDPEGSAY